MRFFAHRFRQPQNLLMAVLSASMALMTLADQETVDGIEWTYTIEDGQATVGIGYWDDECLAIDSSTTGKILIPQMLGGYSVASIGYGAFYNCTNLTSVVVSPSVKYIGEGAFLDCSGLISVTITSYVQIGRDAFSGCTKIRSVTLPDSLSVRDVLSYLFDRSQLTNVTILADSGEICSYMLLRCSGLTAVTIPAGTTSIGEGAFSGCSGLTSIDIPASVTNIGEDAFSGCSGLTSIDVPTSVTNIGAGAFSRCSGLTSIDIPPSVTNIGSSAFSGCSGLESATIHEGVKHIEKSTFLGCSALKTVTIPSSVTSIEDEVFKDCSALSSIVIPAGVTNIGQRAFYGCSRLTTVVLPTSVVSIGKDAFVDCGEIKSLTIPDRFVVADVFPNSYGTLTDVAILSQTGKICDRAFEDCRCLTSVTISSNITEIGESAFENCRRLEAITIPASIKKIDAYAFYGCGRLKTVTYLGEKPEIESAAFEGTGISGSSTVSRVDVVVTNVVVKYVLNSVQPEFARLVSDDTGFINIIAEVKGSCVSVPETWSANYPTFTTKFGTDFSKALAAKTGKKDGAGNDMLVWQDYVAGTDPTDESDVFSASIVIVNGKVTISYSPELDDGRKALRKYTTWGKKSLTDATWIEVPDGCEDGYNFFKVSVEMR